MFISGHSAVSVLSELDGTAAADLRAREERRRADSLFLVRLDGSVVQSADRGLSWQQTGDIDGQPAAFEIADAELYVALHDGTIKRSTDGGQNWRVRSRPSNARMQ